MNIFQSFILGIIEGFTEFLPISSTAHLVLSSEFLHISGNEFVKSFEIVIQLGAILAVVFLYWKKFLLDKEALLKIIAAFVPTAAVGFLLYKIFKSFLMENVLLIAGALFFGGIVLILFELFFKEKENAVTDIAQMSYRQCVFIGLVQSLAIVPGVSRSAATILGGRFFGLSKKTVVEFSFLLAAPTMLAASAYDLLKSGVGVLSGNYAVLFVGFFTSFVVAVWAIKFLLRYIQKNNFILFGVYRIFLGLGISLWFLFKNIL